MGRMVARSAFADYGRFVEKVTAYRVFGIFANYDGNAPDTDTIMTVISEELAKHVCEKLNENPRRHTIVFVDGWEHAKRFRHRPMLVELAPGQRVRNLACDSLEQAMAELGRG